jgi:hypothetical protein
MAAAAEALGEIGDPFAVEPLLAALVRSGPGTRRFSTSVTRAASSGRGSFGGGAGGTTVVSLGAGGNAASRAPDPTAAILAALRNVSGANPGDSPESWLVWARERSAPVVGDGE